MMTDKDLQMAEATRYAREIEMLTAGARNLDCLPSLEEERLEIEKRLRALLGLQTKEQ